MFSLSLPLPPPFTVSWDWKRVFSLKSIPAEAGGCTSCTRAGAADPVLCRNNPAIIPLCSFHPSLSGLDQTPNRTGTNHNRQRKLLGPACSPLFTGRDRKHHCSLTHQKLIPSPSSTVDQNNSNTLDVTAANGHLTLMYQLIHYGLIFPLLKLMSSLFRSIEVQKIKKILIHDSFFLLLE